MLMLSGANLLVLDEPTNHLDVESIETLEDAIDDYDGTVLLVSHDRELLRALTSRVWVLHEGHITEFDDNFAEWEIVSKERHHAASVKAAEEEALRRIQEKKKTARKEDDARSNRNALRAAQKRVSEVEAFIEELESAITALTRQLEDPELYTRPDGVDRARELGVQLDRRKQELERAFEDWGSATEALDTFSVDRA
jgi:ATP-binding cassette subfamily F protein 3